MMRVAFWLVGAVVLTALVAVQARLAALHEETGKRFNAGDPPGPHGKH